MHLFHTAKAGAYRPPALRGKPYTYKLVGRVLHIAWYSASYEWISYTHTCSCSATYTEGPYTQSAYITTWKLACTLLPYLGGG